MRRGWEGKTYERHQRMVITFSENSYTSLFVFSGADFGFSRNCCSVVEIWSLG
jgi:hypothetical protein